MTDLKKVLIFLVDDDSLFLKSLELVFRKRPGYTVKCFTSGEQCLENLFSKPDIIVLDYYLNGTNPNAMDGLETLDKIKKLNPLINVIMLSSQENIEVAVTCLQHKALDYVVKNQTTTEKLKIAINTVLTNHKVEKELNLYLNNL